MGSAQIRLCFHKNRQLVVSLLFLLVSSLTIGTLTAEDITITRLPEAAKEAGFEDVALVRTETIGSRPPRCDRRCNSCGPCEAVQVPASTILQRHKGSHFWSSASVPRTANSRDADISNYKPMSWKCKCGTLLFNP